MGLAPGYKLGPYEIVAPLGAGGMGEVYRAHDSRLHRDVAIKILPQHLAQSPELRERFEREARAISQLSHPHICILHDIVKWHSTLLGTTLTNNVIQRIRDLTEYLWTQYRDLAADTLFYTDVSASHGAINDVNVDSNGWYATAFYWMAVPASRNSLISRLPTTEGWA